MDEIAAVSEAAIAFFGEGVASLGFVRSIVLHVNSQIMGTVGELALAAIGTMPPLHVIFAERALGLGGSGAEGRGEGGEGEAILPKLHFFSFCGGFGFDVEGERQWEIQD